MHYVVKLVYSGVISYHHVMAPDKPTAKKYARDHYRKFNSISALASIGATVVFEADNPKDATDYIQQQED